MRFLLQTKLFFSYQRRRCVDPCALPELWSCSGSCVVPAPAPCASHRAPLCCLPQARGRCSAAGEGNAAPAINHKNNFSRGKSTSWQSRAMGLEHSSEEGQGVFDPASIRSWVLPGEQPLQGEKLQEHLWPLLPRAGAVRGTHTTCSLSFPVALRASGWVQSLHIF